MGSSEEAKDILAPTLRQFHELAIAKEFEKVAAFYDPDAVLVHAGKDAVYGREAKIKTPFMLKFRASIISAILKDLQDFLSRAGKLTPKTYEPHYGMCGDFIIMISDYETETENMGVLKAKLTQIWRKNGDKYLLLHFEDVRK
ncbi:unnamed protein product [Cylicostephanus goldi]|uniref:DUF4440 domain-containing protein n=1 Tax=Cylicostephanus goldi TaxID=71465 RepID=A0A3P7M2D7_CYLGO|nr:unnamed protein product [Cylicostephanus goldi]